MHYMGKYLISGYIDHTRLDYCSSEVPVEHPKQRADKSSSSTETMFHPELFSPLAGPSLQAYTKTCDPLEARQEHAKAYAQQQPG